MSSVFRKLKLSLIVAVCTIFMPLGTVLAAEATTSTSSADFTNVIVPKDAYVTDDYFAVGENINMQGTVQGDATVFGSTTDISGTVEGDLIGASQNMIVSGHIKQDARIAGYEVHLSGKIDGNLWVAGYKVTLSEDVVVGKSLIVAASEIVDNSQTGKNVHLYGEQVQYNGKSEGNVYLRGNVVSIGDKAQVKGNLDSLYNTDVTVSNEASVSGKISSQQTTVSSQKVSPTDFKNFTRSINWVFELFSFLSLLLIGLIWALLFPTSLSTIAGKLRTQPGSSVIAGIFGFPIFMILILLLMFSLVGIPLVFLLVVLSIVATSLSPLFVSVWLGQLIIKSEDQKNSVLWALTLGLVIYKVLTVIPIIGHWFSLVGLVLGMGSLIMALNEARKH